MNDRLLPACACLAILTGSVGFEEIAAKADSRPDLAPDLEGVWVTVLVAFDDPRWNIADLVCARTGCSVEGYAYLQDLLDDPKNAERSTKDVVADMEAYQQRINDTLLTPLARQRQEEFDPSQEASLDCKPDGDDLRHQVLAPLPLEIEQHEDSVILRYEYWNAERIVHLHREEHPEDGEPSRLGHSIGRYEGSTLIVETAQLLPAVTGIPNDKPLMLSPDATAVERYTLSEDGESLDMTLEIIDPSNFTQPFQNHRRMLKAPGWELDTFVCESITGEY
jgi:hypothetical protein